MNLKIAAVFAAFLLFTASAAVCQAQTMVGNYREASKTDKAVVSAAAFAVKTENSYRKGNLLELLAVERAERQTVAGANYRLCLSVKEGDTNRQATAIVYQNLKNEMSLTSWTPGKCSETMSAPGKQKEITAAETEMFAGELQVGKTDSVILYVGAETGDYAAYCFKNDSEAGRKILAACKNGQKCEVTGTGDYEAACEVPGLEADLSSKASITSVSKVKSIAPKRKKAKK